MDRTDLTNGLLCALDMETYEQLAPYLRHAPFGRGDVFYEPGALIEQIYFPHSGVLSLLSVLGDGSAIETSTVGRESAIGLLAALSPLQSFSRVIGQSTGVASRIEVSKLRRVAQASPQLQTLILRHCDALLASAQQSVACNALHDVQERFCRWLLSCHDRVGGEEVIVTQEVMAMMLGVQRTTITQVAGLLQEDGLIRYQRGRITIMNRTLLERRSCECYQAIKRHAEAVLPASPAENGPCEPLSQLSSAKPDGAQILGVR